MNTVLEMQKLVPDTEGKGQAQNEIVSTFTTSVGKSSFSIFMCV
ncbi:class III lanthipeptide [Lysinibacillus sphaericus]